MNGKQQKVVLCDNSLVVASMKINLMAYPLREAMSVDFLSMQTLCDLYAFDDATVVYKLAVVSPEISLPIPSEKTDLTLIGLDTSGKNSYLFSDQRVSLLIIDLLDQMIEILHHMDFTNISIHTGENFPLAFKNAHQPYVFTYLFENKENEK